MDCREARRILRPAEIVRVGDAEVEAALSHAECCDSCRCFIERDRRIAELIRDCLPRVCAPRALRERLYTALARERAKSWMWRGNLLPSGALTVAVVVIASAAAGMAVRRLLERPDPPAAASSFAEDYLRRSADRDVLESPDRREVARFLSRELGLSMAPPEVPGFKLARATICLMGGRRGAVVEYVGGDAGFSYYVVPVRTETLGGARDFARQVGDAPGWRPALRHARGLGVAMWRDVEHEHALVGDLPDSELERLAQLFSASPARL